MKLSPNATHWWAVKFGRWAFSPKFNRPAIGDMDGEWVAIGFGFYRLAVDLRGAP